MLDRAEQLRVFDLAAIQGVLDDAPGRTGAPLVRSLLGLQRTGMTRGELEDLFLAICEAAGLPRPLVNMPIVFEDGAHVEVDFAWPDLKLIVETDGWATHGTPLAFATDRRRDRKLALAEWRVIRFTWHEIEHEPGRVAQELAVLLATAS